MWKSNLEWQQVAPALILLTTKTKVALINTFGKLAEGAENFSQMTHKRVVLSVLNSFVSKAARKREPREAPFHSSNDIRLKSTATVTSWLHEWKLEVINKSNS